MKWFIEKYSYWLVVFATLILMFLLIPYLIQLDINQRKKECINYAKYIEVDYKFHEQHGCFIKRKNIWFKKDEFIYVISFDLQDTGEPRQRF